MSEKKRTILQDKGFFPCTLKELCDRTGSSYSLCEAKDDAEIDTVICEGMTPKQKGLFLSFYETDDQLRQLAAKGIAAFLTDHPVPGARCVVASDPSAFTYRLCEEMRALVRAPAIAIVGSVGKTTLKRMLAGVLRTERAVSYQADNYNTFQALSYSLLTVPCGTELLVQEVDEKRSNNVRNCSEVLKPEIALVTNIAESHLGHFGSWEALTNSFRGITAGMDENGIIIINGDDANSVNAHFDAKIIRVGVHDKSCECVASDIREGRLGVEFDLTYAGETEHIQLSIHGEHNVYNAMMACVTGKLEGISVANIKKGLLSYRNTGIRQNTCSIGNTLIYADCYNASATSVRFALKCFDALPAGKGKKVAVLGDIAEIEGFEEDTYRKIAEALDRTSVDVLVTCGKDSKLLHSYVTRDMEKKHTGDLDELNAYLRTLKRSGGSFLFKASRVMALEKSIERVFPAHYAQLTGKDYSLKTRAKKALSKVKRILMKH